MIIFQDIPIYVENTLSELFIVRNSPAASESIAEYPPLRTYNKPLENILSSSSHKHRFAIYRAIQIQHVLAMFLNSYAIIFFIFVHLFIYFFILMSKVNCIHNINHYSSYYDVFFITSDKITFCHLWFFLIFSIFFCHYFYLFCFPSPYHYISPLVLLSWDLKEIIICRNDPMQVTDDF